MVGITEIGGGGGEWEKPCMHIYGNQMKIIRLEMQERTYGKIDRLIDRLIDRVLIYRLLRDR